MKPLTDAEYDRLEQLLERFGAEHASNLEKLDGFFAALICGPIQVQPSDYLPELWKGEPTDESTFTSSQELRDFAELASRHWAAIERILESGDVFLPVLLQDDQGVAHGNDWAQGFMRGMETGRREWSELLNSEQHGGWLIPIFALAYENDPDPKLRPYEEPMDAERRDSLIAGAAAGVMGIYRHFEPQRRMLADLTSEQSTFRRSGPKVGRNEPCPCGSGKKYKQCCGRPTLN